MNMKNIALAVGTSLIFAFSMQVLAQNVTPVPGTKLFIVEVPDADKQKKAKTGNDCTSMSKQDCKKSRFCTWTKGNCSSK